jgi:hypothetical protein
MATIGRLSMDNLGVGAAYYEPERHYNQVKDSWGGGAGSSGR